MTEILIANLLVIFNHFLDFYFNMKYKEKSTILLSNIATSTISLLSFILLHSIAGAVSCIITILRVMVIYHKDKNGKKWIPLFILFAILYLSPLLDFETPLVILLCISNYILYIPKWFSKNMQLIRATTCIACILLVPYLLYIQNYSGAIFTVVDIVTYFSSYVKWKIKDKENVMKIYIAYGSNLNQKQMKQRCPDSELLGTGYIDDYELLFKQIGIDRGSFLTIEEKKGAKVPVTLYSVSEDDEKSLDKCEEYPTTYYKKDMVISYTDNNGIEKETNAFVYIMHENKPLGKPSEEYIQRVLDGYKTFNFDTQILQQALE